MLFSHRCEHVDDFGVPGVFVGAVGSFSGGVEWQWCQAGSEAWWMVRAAHPSSRRVVLGASGEEQVVEWVVGCARGERAEAAGSKVAWPFGTASRRAYRRCASFRGDECKRRAGPCFQTGSISWPLSRVGEERLETPETRVVPDGVEGVSGERVRQLTAELIEDAPQIS